MKILDLALEAPAANLALDEALLDLAEQAHEPLEILRLWQSPTYFVVTGFGNKTATEVNQAACWRDHIPILRRCTGGGTVLQGPGCLNYTLILNMQLRPELSSITSTNCFVMSAHRNIIQPFFPGKNVQISGATDLALDGRKFSGNAQRRKRKAILFHGSFLLDVDLNKIEEYLLHPSREPEYRARRRHQEFLCNLQLSPDSLKAKLAAHWNATQIMDAPSASSIEPYLSAKYDNPAWIRRI